MFPPPPTTQYPTRPQPRGPMVRAFPDKVPPWGWVEWFLVVQGALPALLFVPGASPLRVFTRIASFVIPLLAWGMVWQNGRKAPRGAAPFPPAAWLMGCAVWLGVSILHPSTNSLGAGLAQASMYWAVLSPAFWVPAVLVSSRQVPRIIMIMFLGNAVSAMMGIGQVYRPETFNPPVIPSLAGGNDYAISGASFLSNDGRRIIRPCGLSDNPGMAGGAGMVTCLLGLCLATRPIAAWKRLGCFGLAMAGMADIYFSQIRTAMVMEFVCIFGLAILFMARGFQRQAAALVVGIGVTLFGAAAWAVSAVGNVSTDRFMTLVAERPDEMYSKSRGHFVQETFEVWLAEYPLGAGLGRWGQAYGVFGNHSADASGMIWIEVQWPGWVIDGGAPLLVAYVVALALAMMTSLHIVLHCKDRDLANWGAVICALNLSVLATAFSQCPFVANSGAGFWLLAATLHSANERTRLGPPAPKRLAAR